MIDPIAFNFFGFEVRWYGILISFAIFLGIIIAIKRAPKNGLIPDTILDAVIIGIPASVIGARIYYVIFKWDYYSQFPKEIIAIWHGGLAIHGGLIAAVIVGILFCKIKKISFYTLIDTIVPSFPLGQAIGRWGNFFNQEAYGYETDLPWAITVNDPIKGLIKVHPTFLYESIWNLLVFAFILYYEKKYKKNNGESLAIYVILYSIGRFFVEGLRTDSLMFLGLRIAQLISIFLIIVGIVLLLYLRKTNNR